MIKTDTFFAIHNFLTMRVRDNVGILDWLLMRPKRGYVHYATDVQYESPDIDVEIGPFVLNKTAETICMDRRFNVSDDWFGCDDTYKVLGWRVEIDGWESGKSRLRIQPSALGTAAIGSRLIDCLVRYHLCSRGAPAIHCCGISRNNGAYLLSGRSGVGKSTLAMQLLDRGTTLLGDNWVIVSKGAAFSFHLPINLYHYNVAPKLKNQLPFSCRFDMTWKRMACFVSAGYLKKSTPVVLRSILPDLVAESAPLKKIFLLSQGPEFRSNSIDRQKALNRLVANDMMDREAFYRYMTAYATCYPSGPVANHWNRLYDSLDTAIPDHVDFVDLVVEKRITPQIINHVEAIIDA